MHQIGWLEWVSSYFDPKIKPISNWVNISFFLCCLQALQYNVPCGKKNRGLATVLAYKSLIGTESQLTPENVRLSHYLGWCVEMVSIATAIILRVKFCLNLLLAHPNREEHVLRDLSIIRWKNTARVNRKQYLSWLKSLFEVQTQSNHYHIHVLKFDTVTWRENFTSSD